MRTLAAIMFAAILTPLGIRLVLPFLAPQLPEFADPLLSLLVWWTNLLAVPFAGVGLPEFMRGTAGAAFGQVQPQILVALIGWSIVQGVVMGVLGLLGRRTGRSGRRRDDHDEA